MGLDKPLRNQIRLFLFQKYENNCAYMKRKHIDYFDFLRGLAIILWYLIIRILPIQ